MQKRRISFILLVSILLNMAACTHAEVRYPSGFAEPDPSTYAQLLPIVREYFYYYKAAVLTGDLDAFYARYPDLQSGNDLQLGINAEGDHVASLRDLGLLDGNIFPEFYNCIKIKQTSDQIQILAHGMALYVYQDENGVFNDSGGEFMLELYLRPDGDAWQIYRTNEVTLQEWKGIKP